MPAPASDRWPGVAMERAVAVAAAGLRLPLSDEVAASLEDLAAGDPEPRVRSAALSSLARGGKAGRVWAASLADPDPGVRRRACELAPAVGPAACPSLVASLDDAASEVAEAAAWAMGELGPAAVAAGAVATLSDTVRSHRDPLVREAAVAALGSLGDPAGLPAVLAACEDRPAIRRRAVVALAAFDGPEVEEALRQALDDRDWQVRQVAEDLRRPQG
jgi:HEAT repeat protein